MSYNVKNYTEQGGEVTHIGGSLVIEEGGSVSGLPSAALPIATASAVGGVKVGTGLSITAEGVLSADGITPAANQAGSTASDVAGLVTDFNALLAKLKAAGLMTPDETE